jgi:hypothetical protein
VAADVSGIMAAMVGTLFALDPKRRDELRLKRNFRASLALSILIAPSCVGLSGCTNPDNPIAKEAPPPPAAKPEELKVPKAAGGKAEYGASSKYQKSMERQFKKD